MKKKIEVCFGQVKGKDIIDDSPYYWKVYKRFLWLFWKYVGNHEGNVKFNAQASGIWISKDKQYKFEKCLRDEWLINRFHDD